MSTSDLSHPHHFHHGHLYYMTDDQDITGRARAAKKAFEVAGHKVVSKITFDAMRQSFPHLSPEDDVFLDSLAKETRRLLEESFIAAWDNLLAQKKFANFNERVKELDKINAEARKRRDSGESEPEDAWIKLVDPRIRISSRVAPVLQQELAFLRQRKEELTKLTDEAAGKVLARQKELASLEAEVQGVFVQMEMADKHLHGTVENDQLHLALTSRLDV